MQQQFHFESLRADWYNSNSAMPRLVRRCLNGDADICFVGFPRQWLAVFEWYGVNWKGSSNPCEYVPVFSDLDEKLVCQLIDNARAKGALRILAESASMYDPVISDFLYILDNTAPLSADLLKRDAAEIRAQKTGGRRRRLVLNGWQSYGRPSLRILETKVMSIRSELPYALVLPCALKRPYDQSRTHRRIYAQLESRGYELSAYHRIVVTSLGVLPVELWSEPEVLTYDAGVPDIYRTLRLTRAFFSKQNYECVFDCLQFEPYSDVLRIAEREGHIGRLEQVRIGRPRHFYVKARLHGI